jgi:hypothetical protein
LHGGWNLGWQFRTQTQVVFDGMVASPKKKKFKSQLEKLWLQNVCYEKDVTFRNFLPGGLQWTLNYYAETTISLNAHLCHRYPTRKSSEVLFLHDIGRLHYRDHQRFWMNSVATSTLQSCPQSIRLHHVFVPSRRKPLRTLLCWSWGTAECWVPVAAVKGEQLLVGGCECSCSKVKKDSLQRWILHWKITVPSGML